MTKKEEKHAIISGVVPAQEAAAAACPIGPVV
jgi:hypothetical protein